MDTPWDLCILKYYAEFIEFMDFGCGLLELNIICCLLGSNHKRVALISFIKEARFKSIGDCSY